MGVVGDVGRRAGGRAGIRRRLLDPHGVLGPVVVGVERDVPRVGDLAVTEPIVDFELNPGGGQQVQGGGRLKFGARQQSFTDQSGAGGQELVVGFGVGLRDGHVAPEPAADRAHQRIAEIVELTRARPTRPVVTDVGLARVGVIGVPAAGVVQVEFAQPAAQADQHRYRDGDRQPRPSDTTIEAFGQPSKPVQDRGHGRVPQRAKRCGGCHRRTGLLCRSTGPPSHHWAV